MSDKKPDDMTRRLAEQVGVYVQADPIPNSSPSMHDLVSEDMQKRKQFGLGKYGTLLQAGNGRHALQDAYDEVLDLAVYLRQAIEESKTPQFGTKIHEAMEAFNEGVGSAGVDQEGVRHPRERGCSADF